MSLRKLPDLFLNISDTDVKTEEIHCYRFKSFILNPLERQLLNCDSPVALAPKAFDILTLLIVNAGHLVTKEELMEAIWADSFVEEANLARLIHTVRKALGEDENGNKFIETVPTKGYRFVAEVESFVTRENRETVAINNSEEWPDRLEPATLTDNGRSGRKILSSRWLFAVIALVIVFGLVAAAAVWRNNTGGTAAKERAPSIAVLPFRPISTGERDLTYDLAFANSIIAALNQSKNLRVRSFAIMRAYTEVTQDPIEIGKERGVDYVLESDYLANGGRLHVTSNLINVQTGIVEGIFEYDAGESDLYAAGRKVTAKIVPDLLAKLNLPAVGQGYRGTENEAAWRSYLQGWRLADKRTVEDAEKGIEEFNNAIKLDPGYAMAYMGLAHAIQTKLTNGGAREEFCGPAREAEMKALELDPTLGDARVMLATNKRLCDLDIAGAEADYLQAVEVSPNSAHVRRFYAVNMSCDGRFDQALEHLYFARELEPNSTFTEKLIGRVLFQARRYDEAIEQSIKTKQLVPEPEQTSFVFMSYEMKGDLDKAFEWFLVVKEQEHESEEDLNAWRRTYAESGWNGVLQRRLDRALEAEKTTDNLNKRVRLLEEITTLSVQLGDYDRAFEYLNKAVDKYVLFAGQIMVDPYLDPIRSDPRYKEVMARTWNRYGGNYSVF